MFCQKCGNQLEENAKFCPKCGAGVETTPPAQTTAAGSNTVTDAKAAEPVKPVTQTAKDAAAGTAYTPSYKPAKKGKGKVFAAVIILALIAVCLVFVLNRKTVVGVWEVDEIYVQNAGFQGLDLTDVANQALKSLLDLTEGSRLAFTKDGEFLVLLPDGTSLPATISWEKKEKDTLTLRMEVSTLLGDVKTKQDCEYQFKGKNTLILQMAGSEITLKRDKDWSLNDFKERAQEKAKGMQELVRFESNPITFGHYEQDNDTSNGAEEIEWIVLKEENGKKLIISKYALDWQKYNTRSEDVTWETCTLRSWLNNDFYNSAFTSEEQAKIVTVTNNNPDASGYDKSWGGKGGNVTSDNVFCLSYEEALDYFSTDEARLCSPTAYATAQGAWTSGTGRCNWRLRSPGDTQGMALDVSIVGSLLSSLYGRSGVRPALWISTK